MVNRKLFLQSFFNNGFKKKIVEYYGENANITVSNLNYIRSKKSTSVSLILYVDNPEKIDDLYPVGVELLTGLAWSVVGDGTPLIIQTSFDLNPTTKTSVLQESGTTNDSL